MRCLCSGRCWLLGICVLQLATISVRQTFDILGLQWSCIVVNFFQFIAIVIAFFGVCHHKRSLLAVYSTWTLIWMGWNVVIVCVYRDVIRTEQPFMILNLDLSGTASWFKVHAYDCSTSIADKEIDQKLCILDFRNIEIFQSGLQLLLSVMGFSASCYVMGITKEDKDHDFDIPKSKNDGENGATTNLLLSSV